MSATSSREPVPFRGAAHGPSAQGEILSLAQAARRHALPEELTPSVMRSYRHALAAEVEAGLAGLWSRACARVGLVDDDSGPAHVPGLALACVGSLARREAGPVSDLDLVVLTDPARASLDSAQIAALAEHLWYPLWDAGTRLDHSVRTIDQCRSVAGGDLPAAVGLLDLRHLAGDEEVTSRASSALLTDWRSATRKRLPELAQEATVRAERFGDFTGLLEPDLKEARGGLRDAVLVRALAASSLADRPHGAFDQAVEHLLAVRDVLGIVTGRPSHVLSAAAAGEVGQRMGLGADASAARDELLTSVYGSARLVAAGLDATMRSALRAARPARRPLTIVRWGRRSAPVLETPDEGVAIVGGEVVLSDAGAHLSDPALPMRVAGVAAARGIPVSPVTRQSLAGAAVPEGDWTAIPARSSGRATMRDLFVELLSHGSALVPVWEDLDLAGLPSAWIPGWAEVRNRPQHNPFHLYTVDRHMVRAAALTAEATADPATRETLGRLGLPTAWLDEEDAPGALNPVQVLRLAALVHDIGKVAGVNGPAHAQESARRVPAVARVWGLSAAEKELLTTLVAEHLLLGDAAGAPPGDEQMVSRVRHAVGEGPNAARTLAMLYLLTCADAQAAGPRAWTTGRRSLLDRAVAHLATAL